MHLASALGLGCAKVKVLTHLVLSINGNAITLSEKLHQAILQENNLAHVTLPLAAYLLQKVISVRAKQNRPKLRFATVFPYSCHHYQLRDWLGSANISEYDLDIMVVPPVNMVAFLQSGEIDGCCVGGVVRWFGRFGGFLLGDRDGLRIRGCRCRHTAAALFLSGQNSFAARDIKG